MYLNKLDLNLVKNKGLPMVSLPRQALFYLITSKLYNILRPL